MNFDTFTIFNYPTNQNKAFQLTFGLFGVMSHLICSGLPDDRMVGYNLI